jgi:virginiamycin B lyase
VHFDANASRATAFKIAGIDAHVPISYDENRACFALDGGGDVNDWRANVDPACLTSTNGVVTRYRTLFHPGIYGIASDAGEMWLVEGGRAIRVRDDGVVHRFAYSGLPTGPVGVVAQTDGSVWLAGAGLIERFASSGASHTYRVTYPGNGPFGVAADGVVGIVFTIGHGVGRIDLDTTGAPHIGYVSTGAASEPEGVVAAANGAVFCTDATGWILRIARDDSVTRYRVPTADGEPFGIASGPDGAVWFTEFFGGKIGRLDPKTGAVAEFEVPYAQSFPTAIVSGVADLWFLDLNGNVGRVTTTGQISEHPVPIESPVKY